MENQEVWKDVQNYEGLYQASNMGNVKSVDRVVWNKGQSMFNNIKGLTLKQSVKGRRYPKVTLFKDGKRKDYSTHQVVAITFLNHLPCGMKLVIDHIDNNPLNNRVDNLQIVTQSFNNYKRYKENPHLIKNQRYEAI